MLTCTLFQKSPTQILELEAYLKHLENGDGQRGKAAEVCNMERGAQLHVAPQRPVHRDSSVKLICGGQLKKLPFGKFNGINLEYQQLFGWIQILLLRPIVHSRY